MGPSPDEYGARVPAFRSMCVVLGFAALPMVAAAALPLAPAGAPPSAGKGEATGSEGPRVAGESAEGIWVERERMLMGTLLRVRLEAPGRQRGLRAAEAAFRAVERVDDQLSTWRSDTELSRLNGAAPGGSVSVSPWLVELLSTLREWTARTEGAFDPTVGSEVDAWGLRGEGRRPSPRDLRRARRASGWRNFDLEAGRRTARRLHGDAWIVAGGFGKGLALERARDALRRRGVESALLNFGGQLLVMGNPPEGRACWSVAVAHPRRRQEAAVELPLCADRGSRHAGGFSLSAATTSAAERHVTVDGERLGHVLDPREGRPVSPWGSVTVVREDPMEADLLSTALFVMGPGAGAEWAREHGVAALVLDSNGGEPESSPDERSPGAPNTPDTDAPASGTDGFESYRTPALRSLQEGSSTDAPGHRSQAESEGTVGVRGDTIGRGSGRSVRDDER